MQLTLFNGSPRGQAGNTKILLEHLATGFTNAGGEVSRIYHLANPKDMTEATQAFEQAEVILLGFPLYTDAMPGIVKAFIESLEPRLNCPNNPKMAFLVQSGFPEAHQLRFVERYLEKLTRRLNAEHLGTIIKGNGEGTRSIKKAEHPLFTAMQQFGQELATQGHFDIAHLKAFSQPELMPKFMLPLFAMMGPLSNKLGWDTQMKENGVLAQSFVRPYDQEK